MFSDIIGVILIISGLIVIFAPKVKISRVLTTTKTDNNWSKTVNNLINKIPVRVLIGFVLIGFGVLLVEPSLAPWS